MTPLSSTQTRWLNHSPLPNHADNTLITDESKKQLFFAHPSESVLVIGEKQYVEQYTERMNKEIQAAHEKIRAELNEKFGTPRSMEASASASS